MLARKTKNSLSLRALAVLVITLITLNGCACRSSRNDAKAQTETRELTDEAGRSVRVPARVERVVTLAPNLTEIVYAVGAGPRLVGNTTYCDYPPEAKQVVKVGDTLQPNIEKIIALNPQLVIVSTASQLEAFTKQLSEHDIAVYVTDPHDLEGIFHSIQNVGDLLGERERAEKLVNDLRARVNQIEERVKASKPVKVFYQVSPAPLYTAGHDSWITDLIRRAGGVSVTANVLGAWPRFSDEAALASHPEAIIMAAGDTMSGEGEMAVAAPLKDSPAVKTGRVYRINGDFLSRPGPRLVEGLEAMARALHPEDFR